MARRKVSNPLDALCERCGISKSHIADALGFTLPGLDYALERGLRDDEVELIEYALKTAGRELLEFKIPASLKQKKQRAA